MKLLAKIFPSHPVFSKSIFSSLLMSLFFGMIVGFFYFYKAENSKEFYSAIFWVFFITTLYFLILKTGQVSRYRSVFFITFAFFFILSFMAGLMETRGNVMIGRENFANLEIPFCHIVIPQTLIPAIVDGNIIFAGKMFGEGATIAGMVSIWFLMSLTIGKGWCSWVCFFGGCDEGFSKIGGKKKRLNLDKIKILRYLPYAVLLLVVLGSLYSYFTIYCKYLCPFKTTTEFPQLVDFKVYLLTLLFVGLFITLVIVLPILSKKRTQCGLFCPFGAFESIFNKTTLFRIKVNQKECINCKKCISECPTFSITEDSLKKGRPALTCTRCGRCIDVCPKSAINYHILGIPFTQKDRRFQPGLNENRFKKRVKSIMNEILDPRVFFISAAMIFGSIIASGYFSKGFLRIAQLFTNGTLILK